MNKAIVQCKQKSNATWRDTEIDLSEGETAEDEVGHLNRAESLMSENNRFEWRLKQ